MPGKDGIEVCKELREKKTTPVIMLTAKGEEANRVQGFEVGADDYIVKPFSPREVVLRVKAFYAEHLQLAICKQMRHKRYYCVSTSYN